MNSDTNYIDGFAFPITRKYLNEYVKVSKKVAEIWKEHGALSYNEFLGDDLQLEGTKHFTKVLNTSEDEIVIFGCVEFPSKEVRDRANQRVAADPRMAELVNPLTDPDRIVFDASRMLFGGFSQIVSI